MVWLIRDRANKDVYKPNEGPDYRAPELFTIKFHHGGHFVDDPKRYVGGIIDFVDLCDVDAISLIELISMCKEFGELGSFSFYYKLPKTDVEKGIWSLEDDKDILEMCEMMPASRIIYVYSVSVKPICVDTDGVATQDFAPSQDPNIQYVDPSTDPFVTIGHEDNGGQTGTYCTEYSHNIRTCPALAADKANGCEKIVKTRKKYTKKNASDDEGTNTSNAATRNSNTADGGNEGNHAGTLRKKTSKLRVRNTTHATNIGATNATNVGATNATNVGATNAGENARATENVGGPSSNTTTGNSNNVDGGNEGTHAGTMRKKASKPRVRNTTHGIQPQNFKSKNNVTTTSRENIMKAREEMVSKMRTNPVWKI